MKQKIFSLMALLALPLFMFAQVVQVPSDTAESPCDRHYEAAVKFIVDTPIIHPFTINAEGGQVIISRGNLQYCPSRDEWRFALRQFDRVGNGKQAVTPTGQYQTPNYGITTVFYDSIDYSTKDATTKSGYKEFPNVPCNNLMISKYYDGWIDLFAWGTSGHGKKSGDSCALYFYPYDLNNATVNATYNTYGYGPSYGGKRGKGAVGNDFDTTSGSNRWFDWGYGNHIREYSRCSHTTEFPTHPKDSTMYRPGVWRTLTSSEWTYLLTKRIVAGNDSAFTYVRLKYGANPTDTVSGVIIYPDDFTFSEAGVGAMDFGCYPITQIDAVTWEALEDVGCVFLPSSRYLQISTTGSSFVDESQFGHRGYYHASTAANASCGTNVFFGIVPKQVNTNYSTTPRYQGLAVRLVQDL